MTTEQRLRRLERQCRLYRNLIIIAGLVLVALLTYGAAKPVPEVIRARSIEVIDAAGKPMVALRAISGGGAIGVFNRRGETAAVLTADETGGGLLNIISGEGRNGVLILGSNADGTGGAITVFNRAEKEAVTLRTDGSGRGVVGAWDRMKRGQTLRGGLRNEL